MHFTLSEPHPDMTFFQLSEADRPLVRSYLVGETLGLRFNVETVLRQTVLTLRLRRC